MQVESIFIYRLHLYQIGGVNYLLNVGGIFILYIQTPYIGRVNSNPISIQVSISIYRLHLYRIQVESTQTLYLHGLPGQHGISKAGQRNIEDVIPVLIASTKCHLGPTSQASHPTIPYLYPQPRHLLSFTRQPWLFMT